MSKRVLSPKYLIGICLDFPYRSFLGRRSKLSYLPHLFIRQNAEWTGTVLNYAAILSARNCPSRPRFGMSEAPGFVGHPSARFSAAFRTWRVAASRF